MQSSAFLEKEVSDLRAENEKKQKRTRSKRQIPHEEGLLVSEAHKLIEAPVEALIAPELPMQEGLHHLCSRVRGPQGNVEYVGSQDIERRHV